MKRILLISVTAAATLAGGCSQGIPGGSNQPVAQATASNKFTPADIAKLKWLEGTWRGMDGEKPFYERYRFEGDGTMVVESFEDETLAKVSDTSRFTLSDGEFGHTEAGRRSAASEITDDHVQFVPAYGGGNSFRFERLPDGTWQAVLETRSAADPAGKKIYHMEQFPAR